MTLYLKYRSRNIEELDLSEVRETLTKIVSSGNIPHAFLFSGPKGSGKTSAARILAKIVNCENLDKKTNKPCDKCPTCISISKGENLDVIELDAASNRGIDDIRQLREVVKLAPAHAKKKVYIIDEAHMLTTEASNALLKTLEEPPEHVIFILATTNPEKLIETIRSRAVNLNFRKANSDEIIRSLKRVVKGENIGIDNSGLKLVAKASDGSFRDAIKILEQLVIEGKSQTSEDIEEYLFRRKTFDVDNFLNILSKRDEKEAILQLEKAVTMGVAVKGITSSLLERLREGLMMKIGISGNDLSQFSKQEIVDLIKLLSNTLSEIPFSVLEQIPLEIAIVEWCNLKSSGNNQKLTTIEEKNDASKTGNDKSKVNKQTEPSKLENNGEKIEKPIDEAGINNTDSECMSDEIWTKVLMEIKPRNTSTEALLRAAKPINFDGRTLTLGVYYRFHKERLESNPHRDILESVINAILGEKVRVVCTLTEPPVKPEIVKDNIETETVTPQVVLTEGEDEDIIRVAKEIFGN